MKSILLRNARIVNNKTITEKDVFIRNGRIERISGSIHKNADIELDVAGNHLLPGIIDDQVHFREPGLTHKANIYSESRAAVAGGVTSYMEMPNTNPTATTQQLLEEKYQIAARNSLANYSFYMGATNENYDEVAQTNIHNVCGIKVFMGSSTGNMLVDNEKTLENIFSKAPTLVATHCEDEATIRKNLAAFQELHKDKMDVALHPRIRSVQACYLSSSMAVRLAKKYNTRLHVLHISTKKELELFENNIPLEQKRITSEVCVHHLFFNSRQYASLGNLIKCNPAIKNAANQAALFPALLDNRLDVIATDHAPHTFEEKSLPYLQAPSGLPLVQHALNIMLNFYHEGKISLETIVEKMCHAPAIAFKVRERGFIEEGYWADLSIVDIDHKWRVRPDNVLYKCAWSPLKGKTMHGKVLSTIVSGHLAYHDGQLQEGQCGQRLMFH